MKYIYCVLIIQIMFSSCTETEPDSVQVMPEESLQIEFGVDTMEIETPQTSREFPYRFPSFDYENQVFAGLDERTNTINRYDLTSFQIKHSIELRIRNAQSTNFVLSKIIISDHRVQKNPDSPDSAADQNILCRCDNTT